MAILYEEFDSDTLQFLEELFVKHLRVDGNKQELLKNIEIFKALDLDFDSFVFGLSEMYREEKESQKDSKHSLLNPEWEIPQG